ncbi:glycerate kinase [Mariniplasma anaerobium]|uniref:Glycerate kinase n=1 Tax=Mariniplasma anaerobium TaxID=2735436 RepID=A0A7U9XVL1_9MOLU|nr:glycerate kinase [Mariniplasma anaerobium]BCR36180.1 glycerate kinase [Mariniplasma anaerobium]
MKILVAVDSYKGSLDSKSLNNIIKKYIETLGHQVISYDISDGGEGFLDAIMSKKKCQHMQINTTGPFDEKIMASYLLDKNVAYIELSKACGISLIDKDSLNPIKTTTYGLGKLVLDAIDKGASHIMMGIGGSATHDLGLGMMQALGVKFYDKEYEIKQHINGNLLGSITSYDTSILDQRIENISFEMITDVNNPLLGIMGAAYTYAPQKGATNIHMIETLEAHTSHFCVITKEKYHKDYQFLKGSGAAGGFGFGAKVFLDAKISHGIDYMIEFLDIKKDITKCDLMIVGEGKLDKQTLNGKAPFGIAKLAKSMDKKVIGVFGMKDIDVDMSFLDSVYTIVPTYASFQESFDHPKKYILEMIKDIELKK